MSWLGLVGVLGLLSLGTGWADVDAGWKALLANDPLQAERLFLEVPQEHPDFISALDGLAICHWLLGDGPAMSRDWIELLQRTGANTSTPHAWWDGYLQALNQPPLQGYDPQKQHQMLQNLYDSPGLSPIQRLQVIDWLVEFDEALATPELNDRLNGIGVVRDWWYVAGPFGLSGEGDLSAVFPPERDLWADAWTGWLGPVRPIPYQRDNAGRPMDRTGWIDFQDITRPEGSVAYAVTVVQGTSEGQARLCVDTNCDIRVWWNGHGVLERNSTKHETSQRLETIVPIHNGPILLVVKAEKLNGWSVRVRVSDPEGGATPWQPAQRTNTELTRLKLHPFSLAGQQPEPDPEATESKTRDDLLRSFYGALKATDFAQLIEARRHLAALQSACKALGVDAWAPARLMEARTFVVEASWRQRSSTRLFQSAHRAYQETLELCPVSTGAYVGLAVYFLQRDQIDQALEWIRKFSDEIWPSTGRPIPAAVMDVWGRLQQKKGWNLRARDSFMKAVEAGWPPSSYVFEQLSGRAIQDGRPVEAMKWIEQGLRHFPSDRGLLDRVVLLPPGCFKADAELAQSITSRIDAARALHPADFSAWRRWTHVARLEGDLKEALRRANEAVQTLPDHIEAKQFQASIQSVAETNDVDAAIKSNQEALAAAPWNDDVRDALKALSPSTERSQWDRYVKYDVSLEDLDLSQADRWNNTRAGSIFLIDLMVLELQPEGTYREYIHQAVKILNEDGRSRWAEYSIPSGVDIIQARTIAEDGTIWPVDSIKSSDRGQSLSFFEVREGAIVEYAYARTVSWNRSPGRNIYAGRYMFGAFEEPMLLSKFVILAPEGITPHFEWAGDPLEPVAVPPTEKGFTVYQWEAHGQDGIKQESFAPPVSLVVPTVSVSTVQRWDAALHEILVYLDSSREPGTWSAEILSEIGLPDSASGRDKAARIVTWVREQIQDGAGSWTAKDVAELRTGGNIPKLMFLEALMQDAGFETAIVSVLPVDLQGNGGDEGFRPNPAQQLGGPLLLRVMLPGDEREIVYIDPSARYAEPFFIQAGYQLALGLVLDPTGPYATVIDPSAWKGGWIENQLAVTLKPDRSAELNGTLHFNGNYKSTVVGLSKNAEQKDQLVRQMVSSAVRGIQVDRADLEGVETLTGNPRITFQGTLGDYLRPVPGEEGVEEIPMCPDPVDLSGRLVREVTRTTPVMLRNAVLNEPFDLIVDLSGLMDNSASILPEIPNDVLWVDQFGVFTLTTHWEGSTLRIRRSILIPPLEVEPRRYPDFTEFCRRVDEAERAKLYLHTIGNS